MKHARSKFSTMTLARRVQSMGCIRCICPVKCARRNSQLAQPVSTLQACPDERHHREEKGRTQLSVGSRTNAAHIP
eukprot:6172087-Pleurochrysis_carterae.AAC.1